MAKDKYQDGRRRNRSPAHTPANRARAGRTGDGQFTPSHPIGKRTRFKPGRSGNPSGRPKKTALDYAIEEFLHLPGKDGKRTNAGRLVQAIFNQAVMGDVNMVRLIAERIGGKPMRQVRLEGSAETSGLTPQQRKARIKELLGKPRKE